MKYEDDDERKDAILQMLGGEVDDYTGSQLEDPDKPSQGVTIEISVKPHGGPDEEEGESKEVEDGEHNMADGNEEHDPIAHILGMCGGGCTE